VTTGQTSASVRTSFGQNVENVRTFAGQTVTLSFWAKAASGTPKVYAEVNQVFGSGGSAVVSGNGSQVTLSTSWARYSVTINLASIAGKTIGANSFMSPTLWVSAGTDFNARTGSLGIQSNTFDFWGIQLEAGSVATPFKRNANSIQGELAACQRYYQRFGGLTTYQTMGNGFADQTTTAIISVPLPTTMRVAPTSVDFSTLNLSTGGSNIAVTGLTILANNSGNGIAVVYPTVSSGLTQFRPYALTSNNSTNGFLGLSAEL
jgi:hypothetical protein